MVNPRADLNILSHYTFTKCNREISNENSTFSNRCTTSLVITGVAKKMENERESESPSTKSFFVFHTIIINTLLQSDTISWRSASQERNASRFVQFMLTLQSYKSTSKVSSYQQASTFFMCPSIIYCGDDFRWCIFSWMDFMEVLAFLLTRYGLIKFMFIKKLLSI